MFKKLLAAAGIGGARVDTRESANKYPTNKK